MATITGFTAERMLEIENETIVDGTVDVNGDLVLTRRDGVPINAGSVIGPEGPMGNTLNGYVESLDNKGNVSGAVSLDFGLYNIWRLNPIGAISISFLNAPTDPAVATSGTIILDNTNYAITWPAATQFPYDEAPRLEGKSVLSVLAYSAGIIVNSALVAVV